MKNRLARIIVIALLFMVATYSEAYADAAAGIAVTVTVEQIGQVAGVSIRLSPKNRRARAGETASLRATIRNMGNGNDSFILTASSSLGWSVEFPQGDTVGPIKPKKREIVPVRVIIPPDAGKGDGDRVTITATSQFDPSVSDSSFSVIVAR